MACLLVCVFLAGFTSGCSVITWLVLRHDVPAHDAETRLALRALERARTSADRGERSQTPWSHRLSA